MPIECKVCGQSFKKQITNSHLKRHDMTTHEYKERYGEDSLSCPNYRAERAAKMKGKNNPNYGNRYEWTDEQKDKKRGKSTWNKGMVFEDTSVQQGAARKREERYQNGDLERKGHVMTDEIRQKISNGVKEYAHANPNELSERGKRAAKTRKQNGHTGAMKGKKHTELSKKKISEASKRNAIKIRKGVLERATTRAHEVGLSVVSFEDGDINVVLGCNTCNETFMFSRQYLDACRIHEKMCPYCHPRETCRSEAEKEIYEIVRGWLPDAKHSVRNVISGEIDIYVPSKNIGVEFNGLYWHSDEVLKGVSHDPKKDYHKSVEARANGVRLIQVFEDEWHNKRDIVVSRLKSVFGVTDRRIYARKCVVVEVSSRDASQFCERYHIQGKGRSNKRLGLVCDGELVAVMTFSNNNISRKINEWEINRFCSVDGTTVVGGASKLFKKFLEENDFPDIISYADNRWSNGDLYKTLGFQKVSDGVPNYWYFLPNEMRRQHRYSLRKDSSIPEGMTEKEGRKAQGYYLIYDSGSSKWEYKK